MGRWYGIWMLLLFPFSSLAIDAVIGHTIFYGPDAANGNKPAPYVTAYWQVNPRKLHYTTTPQKMIIARIKTDIVFMNENGIVKEDHFVLQTPPKATPDELNTLNIIDQRKYALPAGTIWMKFVLTDLNDSANRFTYGDSFTVAPVAADAFLSSLQLLDTIIDIPAETVFRKNNRQQIPLSADFLGSEKTNLHLYAELYNAGTISKDEYPLTWRASISKKAREYPLGGFSKSDTLIPAGLTPITVSFPIGRLHSGNYFVNLTVETKNRRVLASSTRFFQRMNTHPLPDDTAKQANAKASDTAIENITVLNLDKTFLAKYTLAEIRSILKMLLPFSDNGATQTINGFLRRPEELYMRYYVYNYFSAINKKDPAQAWKEFSEKIRAVNKLYSGRGTAGYETDRGFMYLKYGEPADIVTVESESGALPYEVWQYNSLTMMNGKSITDAFFLFYRPGQTIFDFKLLHSNVPGEAYNSAWRATLYNTGMGSQSVNSRAEQYIRNR